MSNSALAGQAIIEFPAGMIMPYAGAAIPSGWLECNGAEVDISAYPRLAAALGSTWNTAKNPLTGATYAAPAAGKFRVPDMRGAFLRGSSGGSNNAQGVATGLAEFQAQKTAKNGISAASSSISGTVGGSDGSHTHGTGYADTNAATSGSSTNLMTFHQSNSNNVLGPRTDVGTIVKSNNSGHGHSFSQTAAAQAITGDAETRPDAVGVRYLIKI